MFFNILLVVVSIISPRVSLLLIAVLRSAWLYNAFETKIWPVMGFLLMPYTTLAYMVVKNSDFSSGWSVVLLLLAALIDFSNLDLFTVTIGGNKEVETK